MTTSKQSFSQGTGKNRRFKTYCGAHDFRKSNTDQGGAGQFVPVPRIENRPCAVAAVEARLAILEKKKGPLFRSFSPRGELREARIDGRVVTEVANGSSDKPAHQKAQSPMSPHTACDEGS
jgi:hypothetical protein